MANGSLCCQIGLVLILSGGEQVSDSVLAFQKNKVEQASQRSRVVVSWLLAHSQCFPADLHTALRVRVRWFKMMSPV